MKTNHKTTHIITVYLIRIHDVMSQIAYHLNKWSKNITTDGANLMLSKDVESLAVWRYHRIIGVLEIKFFDSIIRNRETCLIKTSTHRQWVKEIKEIKDIQRKLIQSHINKDQIEELKNKITSGMCTISKMISEFDGHLLKIEHDV
jgi:signal-transduction protein with cAMP-binding, CBS, and nucleotidyltransferase domain